MNLEHAYRHAHKHTHCPHAALLLEKCRQCSCRCSCGCILAAANTRLHLCTSILRAPAVYCCCAARFCCRCGKARDQGTASCAPSASCSVIVLETKKKRRRPACRTCCKFLLSMQSLRLTGGNRYGSRPGGSATVPHAASGLYSGRLHERAQLAPEGAAFAKMTALLGPCLAQHPVCAYGFHCGSSCMSPRLLSQGALLKKNDFVRKAAGPCSATATRAVWRRRCPASKHRI